MLRLSSTSAFNGHKALIQEVSEICKLIIIASSAPQNSLYAPATLACNCTYYGIRLSITVVSHVREEPSENAKRQCRHPSRGSADLQGE